MKINIGIDEKNCKELADSLSHLLADTYILYLKTQNFHWNVVGPHFYALHKMLEEQYEALAEATDVIAERIRSLGFFAPASFAQFSKLTNLQEATGELAAEQMIQQLVADHETLIRKAREIFPVAERANDESTADLVTERLRDHEKLAWMLRSLLVK